MKIRKRVERKAAPPHCPASLTPRQRTAFRLYFTEQRKYDEICGIMHMNYPCVRNLVHRGMQKMRASKIYHANDG